MSFQSIGRSSVRYSHSMDLSVGRGSRRRGYGRVGGADEGYESASSPSSSFRVPKKLRILKLGSRRVGNSTTISDIEPSRSGQPRVALPSRTFLGRLRDAYEKVMVKAATKTGEMAVIPVAKASRVPPTFASVVNTWHVSSSFSSRRGTKIGDLDPGFQMTTVEKKYLEHLKRSASSGRF